MKKSALFGLLFFNLYQFQSFAQCYQNSKGEFINQSGEICTNTNAYSVPFLLISPDARTLSMGNVGISTTSDANAMHYNSSKLSFTDNKMGYSINITPYLRSLSPQNLNFLYLGAYQKLNKNQTIGFSTKYLNLGKINYIEESGSYETDGKGKELELNVGFIQKLSSHFAIALNGKYIYSHLANELVVKNNDIKLKTGNAAAVDFSVSYQRPIKTKHGEDSFRAGMNIANIGTKITYSEQRKNDYLPANIGLGVAYNFNINPKNTITFAIDARKLCVPFPKDSITDHNPNDGVPDWKQKNAIAAFFNSFTDSPSAKDEFKSINYNFGAEYAFQKKIFLRCGIIKGNRYNDKKQYFTLGTGYKYQHWGLNLAYMVSGKEKSPLDNTMSFSITFN